MTYFIAGLLLLLLMIYGLARTAKDGQTLEDKLRRKQG